MMTVSINTRPIIIDVRICPAASGCSAMLFAAFATECAMPSAPPNVTFRQANILHLDEPDGQFDVVIAANVIHLLDEPYKALAELDRVCRSGGTIIVPTYMNRSEQGKTSGFASTVGKAGADFKRQFTFDTYKQFIAAAGYDDVDYAYCPGRVPCAVAVIHKP